MTTSRLAEKLKTLRSNVKQLNRCGGTILVSFREGKNVNIISCQGVRNEDRMVSSEQRSNIKCAKIHLDGWARIGFNVARKENESNENVN